MPRSETDSWLNKSNNKPTRRIKRIKRTLNWEIKKRKLVRHTSQATFSRVLTILLRPIKTRRSLRESLRKQVKPRHFTAMDQPRGLKCEHITALF